MDALSEFMRESELLVRTMGGDIARRGVSSGFPAPRLLDLGEHPDRIYSDAERAIIRAGIATGLNANETARAMYHAGLDDAYWKMKRLARTETVSAYWKNQWSEATSLGLEMVWSAERGARTCYYCLSKEGMIVEDPSLRDHPNGRCTLIPRLPQKNLWKTPDPHKVYPYPSVRDPNTPSGLYVRSRWNQSYAMTDYWRRNYQNLKGDPLPAGMMTGGIPRTLGSFMSQLAMDFLPSPVETYVWRSETSSIFNSYPRRNGFVSLTAPTATAIDYSESLSRVATSAIGSDHVVLYSLMIPRRTRIMLGNRSENEILLMAGSRVEIVSTSFQEYDGQMVEFVRGVVHPPIVGEIYYGDATYNSK